MQKDNSEHGKTRLNVTMVIESAIRIYIHKRIYIYINVYINSTLESTTLSERRFNLKAPDRINIRSNAREGSINPLILGILQVCVCVCASFLVPLSTSLSFSRERAFTIEAAIRSGLPSRLPLRLFHCPCGPFAETTAKGEYRL